MPMSAGAGGEGLGDASSERAMRGVWPYMGITNGRVPIYGYITFISGLGDASGERALE